MKKTVSLAIIALLLLPLTASANVAEEITVTSTKVKGAINDTVSLKFTMTSKRMLECSNLRVKLEGRDSAHTNILFIGNGNPPISEREENAVSWTGKEIHAGDSLTFTANAKITKGTVGSIIDKFVVLAGCGQHYWFEVSEGTPSIEVAAPKSAITKTTPKKLVVKSSAKNLASISDLNSLFRSVEGRTPTVSEWHYWAKRLLDKSDRTALVGAMAYHKANKIRH